MKSERVLFLCIGNTARSQMAEAFLRKYAGNHFKVYSAGLKPGVINPFTERVMLEIGMDISSQHSKSVTEYLGKMNFSYLITVCSKEEDYCPTTFPGISNRLAWVFDNPAAVEGTEEERLKKFREVRDQIEARIKSWLQEQGLLKTDLHP